VYLLNFVRALGAGMQSECTAGRRDVGEVRDVSAPEPATRPQPRAPTRPFDVLPAGEWSSLMTSLGLSSREADLVRHACHGRSVAETAQAIGISEHTIHTYRDRLYRKLGARSLSEVVAIVFAAYVTLSLLHRTARSTAADV